MDSYHRWRCFAYLSLHGSEEEKVADVAAERRKENAYYICIGGNTVGVLCRGSHSRCLGISCKPRCEESFAYEKEVTKMGAKRRFGSHNFIF